MTPAETQAAFSEVREALDGAWWEYPNALKHTEDGQLVAKMLANGKEKLARIESEVARLSDALHQEILISSDRREKLARLERIEEAARKIYESRPRLEWNEATVKSQLIVDLFQALAAEEECSE